jgi:hypothetical protein
MPIPNANFVAVMFLFELKTQCGLLERAGARLREYGEHWKLFAAGTDDGNDAPPIEIVATCITALSAAAAIKRTLFVGRRQKNLPVVRRCAALMNLLGNPALPTIGAVSVRNSWEHADERLDSMLANRTPGTPVSEIYISPDPPASSEIALRRFDPVGFAIHYANDTMPLDEAIAEAQLASTRSDAAFKRLQNEIVPF